MLPNTTTSNSTNGEIYNADILNKKILNMSTVGSQETWTLNCFKSFEVQKGAWDMLTSEFLEIAIIYKGKNVVTTKINKNLTLLKFAYDKDIVDAIKTISPVHRTYVPKYKYWVITSSHLDIIKNYLNLLQTTNGYKADPLPYVITPVTAESTSSVLMKISNLQTPKKEKPVLKKVLKEIILKYEIIKISPKLILRSGDNIGIKYYGYEENTDKFYPDEMFDACLYNPHEGIEELDNKLFYHNPDIAIPPNHTLIISLDEEQVMLKELSRPDNVFINSIIYEHFRFFRLPHKIASSLIISSKIIHPKETEIPTKVNSGRKIYT